MKTIFAVLLTLICSLPTFAQDNAKAQDIKKLLDLTGAVKVGIQTMDASIEVQKKANASIPPEFWTEFISQVTEEAFVKMISPIYDKYYSHQEITQLIAFYQTPLGQKTISVLPQIAQEYMAAGQEMGKRIAQNVVDKMKASGKY